MSLGTGIVVFVIGAILAFAINIDLDVVDLNLIGYILMGAGALIVLISIPLMVARRRSVSSTRVVNDPRTGNREVRQETSLPPSSEV